MIAKSELNKYIYAIIKNLHLIIAEINFNSTGDSHHIYEVLLLKLIYVLTKLHFKIIKYLQIEEQIKLWIEMLKLNIYMS